MYLKPKQRKEFDKLYKPIGLIDLQYDFFDLKNVREVEEKIDKLNKTYPEDFRKKYHQSINVVSIFGEK